MDDIHHRDKRPDRNDSPRKHKKSQQYTALLSDKDDTDESVPIDENVSQCGMITHPNQKIISSQTKKTNTARVHQPLAQITDTRSPRSLLMDRSE